MNCMEEGRIGEKIIREYFASKNIKHFQIDWMTDEEDEFRLNEIKYQEVFKPPPFYGHGLPKYQVEARMNFYHRTRIPPYFYVVEKSEYEKKEGHHLIWMQSFIILEIGKYIDTKGMDRRRVYEIDSFKKIYFAKE